MARLSLVSLERLRPDVIFDLRYATTRNLTGEALDTEASIARLDMAAATKLSKAATDFKEQGYTLVLWDALRSEATQLKLRAFDPDGAYVLEHSQHVLGLAVDVTLADAAGELLDMGTDHDEFSERAHDGAADLTETQQLNRSVLKSTMSRYGFVIWPSEWWHFDYKAEVRKV